MVKTRMVTFCDRFNKKLIERQFHLKIKNNSFDPETLFTRSRITIFEICVYCQSVLNFYSKGERLPGVEPGTLQVCLATFFLFLFAPRMLSLFSIPV